MTISIRAGTNADDVRDAIAPIMHYFGVSPPDEAVSNFTMLMTPARVLVARDGVTAVAGCGTFPLRLTTPGGHVKASGVSMVGVMPTHRRRGILRAMMQQIIDDCRVREEPVAYLWPSEERIYGRYGYGVTALSGDIHVSRDHASLAAGPTADATLRRVPVDAALRPLSMIFAKVAERTPGAFARSDDWWRLKTLTDPTWRRRGGGELQCLVADIDGHPAAYALYRMNFDTERGQPSGTVEIVEAVAATPEAGVALWSLLLELDWTSAISASFLPLDHPLILSAAEARRLNLRLRDGAWLRLVDLEPALAARAWGPDEIVVEVADALCPWNAGRWRIGRDGARRTDRRADIVCEIAALASVYLGGFSWRQLVASSRAFAASDEALRRADRVFESHGAPWCPEIF